MAKPAKRVNPVLSKKTGPLTWHPCDQCGYSAIDGKPIARALWKVGIPRVGVLYFCGHHFREYSLSFMAHNYVMAEV
jgi:hypothetical protein